MDKVLKKMTKAEKEELEREEERKKALKYFTAAAIDKKLAAEEKATKERINRNWDDFIAFLSKSMQDRIPQLMILGKQLVCAYESAIKKKNEYFNVNLESSENQELKNSLKALGLKKSHFATAALCATGKHIVKVVDHINKRVKPDAKLQKELDSVRSDSIDTSRDAIISYANGKSTKFAKLLYEGLKNGCKRFADPNTSLEESMQWSAYVSEMLFLLKRDPKVLDYSGINAQQLTIAQETADFGIKIQEGVQTLEFMQEMQKQGVQLTEAQKKSIKEKLDTMSTLTRAKQTLVRDWDEPVKVSKSMSTNN